MLRAWRDEKVGWALESRGILLYYDIDSRAEDKAAVFISFSFL